MQFQINANNVVLPVWCRTPEELKNFMDAVTVFLKNEYGYNSQFGDFNDHLHINIHFDNKAAVEIKDTGKVLMVDFKINPNMSKIDLLLKIIIELFNIKNGEKFTKYAVFCGPFCEDDITILNNTKCILSILKFLTKNLFKSKDYVQMAGLNFPLICNLEEKFLPQISESIYYLLQEIYEPTINKNSLGNLPERNVEKICKMLATQVSIAEINEDTKKHFNKNLAISFIDFIKDIVSVLPHGQQFIVNENFLTTGNMKKFWTKLLDLNVYFFNNDFPLSDSIYDRKLNRETDARLFRMICQDVSQHLDGSSDFDMDYVTNLVICCKNGYFFLNKLQRSYSDYFTKNITLVDNKWTPKNIISDNLKYIFLTNNISTLDTLIKRENILYYGNSGTGKTYKINEKVKEYKEKRILTIYLKHEKQKIENIVFESIFCFFFHLLENVFRQRGIVIHGEQFSHKGMHLFVDEFNRGNNLEKISSLNFLLDKNEMEMSGDFIEEDFENNKKFVMDFFDKYFLIFTKYLDKQSDKTKDIFILFYSVLDYYYLRHINNVFYTQMVIGFAEKIEHYLKNHGSFESHKNKGVELDNYIFPIFATSFINFSLIMNTVDHGTKELDLMLNRRFKFEYIPYEVDNKKIIENKLPIYIVEINEEKLTENWWLVQKAINEIIQETCHESKCLGYYFWNSLEVDFLQFKNKIIYYIFNTVLSNGNNMYFKYNIKDSKNSYFFQDKSFEKLLAAKSINEIFSDKICDLIDSYKNQEKTNKNENERRIPLRKEKEQ